MSTATIALSLREAREVAAPLIEALRPHCERVEVAGSIRRGKPFVNDIEIVCVPKTVRVTAPKVTRPADLFAAEEATEETKALRIPGFVNVVDGWQTASLDYGFQSQWHNCQNSKFGSAWEGNYCKFHLENGTQVDLFITVPEQWGYIFLIRTGSADFSKLIATRWAQTGHKGINGELTRHGLVLHFREEDELFAHRPGLWPWKFRPCGGHGHNPMLPAVVSFSKPKADGTRTRNCKRRSAWYRGPIRSDGRGSDPIPGTPIIPRSHSYRPQVPAQGIRAGSQVAGYARG